jgi:signal transduction histidine kinase
MRLVMSFLLCFPALVATTFPLAADDQTRSFTDEERDFIREHPVVLVGGRRIGRPSISTTRRSSEGDEHKFRQVLINLLGNAVKFTDSGAVTLRSNGGPVQGEVGIIDFSVEDSGIGTSPADQVRISNPLPRLMPVSGEGKERAWD